MHDRHRDVALFRYSLIREAADAALTKAERGALVRALAAREHTGPTGERVRLSRNTIDRWIRTWRAGGFEALVPTARSAEPRTPGGGVGAGREAQGRSTGAHRRPGGRDHPRR